MSPLPAHGLAAQQEALLHALFGPSGGNQATTPWHNGHAQNLRGLQAYQSNGHALAERSLRATYPVLAMMLGEANLAGLARAFWHRHPPTRGDMAHWGDALPDFLAARADLADMPYLADVARVEWALHTAASAVDATPDPASFARLTDPDAAGLTLTLAPGTALIDSPHPVVSLVQSHRHGMPSLADAAQRLREAVPESALVWRQGFRPCVAQARPVEAALLRGLLQGQDLSAALDAALATALDDTQTFDFSLWLADAVRTGLVTGVPEPKAEAPHPPEPEKAMP
jgi:hypothetical protein